MPGRVNELSASVRSDLEEHRRRRRLRKLLLGLGAVGAAGAGVYALSRSGNSGNSSPLAKIPAQLPGADTNGSGIGKKVLSALAIPAGAGLAIAGGRFAVPALRKPIAGVFGKGIAQAARKNGITRVYDKANKASMLSWLNDFLNTGNQRSLKGRVVGAFTGSGSKTSAGRQRAAERLLSRLGMSFEGDKVPAGKVKLRDFNPNVSGRADGSIGAVSSARANRLWDNKDFQREMTEAAGAGGVMPRGLSKAEKTRFIQDVEFINFLNDAISGATPAERARILRDGDPSGFYRKFLDKGMNDSVAQSLLQKSTGKKWFFKSKGNTAGRLPGEDYLAALDDAGAWDVRHFLKNTAFEEYSPSRKFSPLRQRFLRSRPIRWITKKLPTYAEYGGREFPMHTEYRVHVVNGQVVPFATSEKWDPLRHFSRFTNKEKQSIERQVQDVIDKIVKYQEKNPRYKGFRPGELDIRKQILGLDVGISPEGKAIIYEMNPSMPNSLRNGSGQLLHPDVMNAVDAAIKGRMPAIQKLQLLLGGAGVAGGAGMAAGGIGGLAAGDR